MTIECTPDDQKKLQMKTAGQGGGNPVYGFGLIGAWMFYIGRATTTQERIKGFFKGFVWPAMLVYELFTFLHKESDS